MGADPNDRTLVAAAQDGDRRALDELLRRHYDRIHAVCRRIAGNDADGLDATQEALIAICRGLPRFDGRSSFATWAYRVATNACLDEVRRRTRRPTPVDDETMAEPATRTDAGAEIADRLEVDQALAGVAPEFRAAVVLRDLCDLDYAQIASILDVPVGTVRSRIARGRAALARTIGNSDDLARRPSSQP